MRAAAYFRCLVPLILSSLCLVLPTSLPHFIDPSPPYAAIPNGWELSQQQTLRQACIEAGLVTPDRAHTIEFLPEAEASVNFCVQSSSSNDWLEVRGWRRVGDRIARL